MDKPAIVSFSSAVVEHIHADQWFAVSTRSHHEKNVAEQFRGKGLEYFLPLYTSARRWKDRVKVLQMPLFAGYIFVRVSPTQFLDVLQTHGVSRLIGSPKPLPLEEMEIQQLRTCLSLSLAVEPNPYLRIGQLVRVRRGPLTNVEGILVRKKNVFRLVVSIDLIQRSVALEIDAADVVPAGNGRNMDHQNMPSDRCFFPDVA